MLSLRSIGRFRKPLWLYGKKSKWEEDLMPENPDLPGLGQRLRHAREDAGLSQAQAAKLLGLHRPAITEIEAESRKVSAGELRNFASLYHVSTSWLLGEPTQVNEQLK